MPNPDTQSTNLGQPNAPENPTTSELSVVKPGDSIGYVRSVHRRSRQNPTVSQATKGPSKPDKKPKPIPIFTKIPTELEDTYVQIMFSLGHRNPDAQRNRSNLRTIVAEIEDSKNDHNRTIEVFSRAISLIHLSNEPNRKVPLTPKQTAVILKDPIGHIALDIMQFGQNYGLSIPPMKYRVVERLTHLRDEYNAVSPHH
jgi:hypothetical protein